MPVALDASCQLKRSSCSFESFFCLINCFVRSISVVHSCPTSDVKYCPTSVVHCRPIAVARCRPTAVARCRPTSIPRCCPTSVASCRPNSVTSCHPTSVARCRLTSHLLLPLHRVSRQSTAALSRQDFLLVFLFRMLEAVHQCTGTYNH